jgi:hypothetical protein
VRCGPLARTGTTGRPSGLCCKGWIYCCRGAWGPLSWADGRRDWHTDPCTRLACLGLLVAVVVVAVVVVIVVVVVVVTVVTVVVVVVVVVTVVVVVVVVV